MKDPAALAEQYATYENLRVRIETHHRYTVGPELEPAVDAALALTGTEHLLDVGTGPGDFPGRLRSARHRGRLVGLDMQPGMVETARSKHPGVEFVQGVAGSLPFPDASFDVVTARHMLYHVPDIPAALREFRRVLKPGGKFLAITNSRRNLAEFREAVAEALGSDPLFAPLRDERTAWSATYFSEESGEPLVREAFGNASVTFMDAALVFPEPEPVLRYFGSSWTRDSFGEAVWERAVGALRRVLEDRFQGGPWRVSKRTVLIMAVREAGGP